jgi:23S rRNA (guanine745-N1)-methyltransferase
VAAPPLACTVRSCGRPLTREPRRLVCPQGHSFDVARSGYISLLQPQDRRSRTAGDSKAAVDARARLLSAGVGRAVVDAVVDRVVALVAPQETPVVADLGCGSGEALSWLAARRTTAGIGIDLSVAAVDHAARCAPGVTWVVANADRRLPILDESVQLVLSLHGRRNPSECARVLAPGGALIVAVPAADDLIELRSLVQGQAVERERVDAVVAAHAPFFSADARFTVREQHRLEGDALRDLLRGTYRGRRASAAAHVEALDALEVTIASDVLVLARC